MNRILCHRKIGINDRENVESWLEDCGVLEVEMVFQNMCSIQCWRRALTDRSLRSFSKQLILPMNSSERQAKHEKNDVDSI